MGLRLDHRVQEAMDRGARGVEIDIWPQHTTGRVRNYQQLLSSIPSLSKEDVMLVQNGRKIDHWVESQGEVWGELPELGPEHQTVIALVGQRGDPNLSDGDAVFDFFDDFLGSSLDAEKWNTTGSPTISLSGSVIRITCDAAEYIQTVKNFSRPAKIISRLRDVVYGNNYPTTFHFGSYTYPATTSCAGRTAYTDGQYMLVVENGSNRGISSGFAVVTDWDRWTVTWQSASAKLYQGSTQKAELTSYIPSDDLPLTIGLTRYTVAQRGELDWIAVAKMVDVEPIVSIRRTLSRSQLEAAVRAQL